MTEDRAVTPVTAPAVPTLRTNVSWTFVGNVVFSACQWLVLSVLAKAATPAVVGQYALALAVTAPVVMLANLQLRAVLATDVRGTHRFDTFVRLRAATCIAALVVIGVLAVAGRHDNATRWLIILVGLSKCVEALSDLVYGMLQRDERMQRIATSMILRGLVSLAAFAAGMLLTGSLLVAVGGLTVAWLLVLVAYDAPPALAAERTVANAPDPAPWSAALTLAQLALPLGVTMMLISLNVNVPRYFVESALGARALGVFAALSAPMAAGLLIVGALGQAATPRLARQATLPGHEGFRTLLWKLACIGVLIGAAGVVVAAIAGGPILRLLFSAEYAEYTRLFVWLNVVSALGYVASFFGYAMTALRRFRAQVPLFAAVVGVTALVSWLAIPRYGLEGAAMALGASALTQLAGSWWVVERTLRGDGQRSSSAS